MLEGRINTQCDVLEGEEVKQLWASDSWECTETHMKQRSIHRVKPQRSELLQILSRERKTERDRERESEL